MPDPNPLFLRWPTAAAAFTLAAMAPVSAEESLADLVVTLQGSDSTHSFSHGNTYPAVALPFAMNAWSPFTQPVADSFYYQYQQNRLRGLRQTHQPSPWIADYAALAVMPVSGKLVCDEEGRASEFSHDTEIARPYYYKAELDTWNVTAEMTPTERCASFRFTYSPDEDGYVIFDGFPKGSSVEVQPDQHRIVGWVKNNNGGVPENFANYFIVQFDQPFLKQGTWKPGSEPNEELQAEDEHVGAWVQIDPTQGPVTFKIASSFIDRDQAQTNLDREIGDKDFDAVKQAALERWNDTLGRIEIEGGTDDERKTFYTALYRSTLFPHRLNEPDENGKNRYFSPYDGKIHEGMMFTDSGFWDTFRCVHPLFNILFPEMNGEILQGVLAAYEQSGWLPAWASPGHRGCMIGNHAFSLFADAYGKGVRNFDAQKAVEAMLHDSSHEGPIASIGRDGAPSYLEKGYAAHDITHESAAKTLEYAYNDFCAALVAEGVGNSEAAKTFRARTGNYKKLWDPEVGFMRGRLSNGEWMPDFDPARWGSPFTEGCSWHYTWSVFHDVQGLIDLMGGDEAFTTKLDSVFQADPRVNTGAYGGMIHEMAEMVAANMGQYAHGNQPIQHMIYLYGYAGQPWKTQVRAREVMARLYHPTPDGLCGDEDNGQTSAWYVFSALGMYPVNPAVPEYVIGSPLFDKATIHLENGKTFTINTAANGPMRHYIQEAKINGESLDRCFLKHDEIANGGEVFFRMGSYKNEDWAAGPDARPFSESRNH
ncbi:putative alpha-1,2-mannosidase [Haloferula luteola]|uniref:Putative alpha-1,2-mannosidase n=1 Tax=Haloferula luteola TaxID=595692 RepID=A0A840V4C1_9BACT|nr:GH92 family glycosyl hydrolase [Haloferula luteola]MBB5352393.1 putative alpha-1,2-mannosidase [Haloferula luteola]